MYTILMTNKSSGSSAHYYTARQTLNYLGIPVNLKFNIFSWRGLELYASAGALGEKCVAGSVRTEYFIDNKPIAKESERLVVRPIQWSVSASAGIEYHITPLIGIYLEPGAGYYFDDGSKVESVYKAKPLNFNLNVGLQLYFGQ